MVGDRPIELDLAVGVHTDRSHIHMERMAQVNPHEFTRAVSDFIEDYLAGPNQILEPYEPVECPDEVEGPEPPPTPLNKSGPPRTRRERKDDKAGAIVQEMIDAARADLALTAPTFNGKCPICLEPVLSPEGLERHKNKRHAA